MAKPMRSVVRKQCSTRFHVQTQPLPVCTWHANPPELSARHCGCSPKLCAHRQTERSPSACESVRFGKAAIVRQQKNKALQTKIQTVQRKSAGSNRKRRLCKRKPQKEQEKYRKQQIKGCFTNENRDKQVEKQNNVSLKHNVS